MHPIIFPMEITKAALYVWNTEINLKYGCSFFSDEKTTVALDTHHVSFRTLAGAETGMIHVHIVKETIIDPRAQRVIAVPFQIREGVYIFGGASAEYIFVPAGTYILTFEAIPKACRQASNGCQASNMYKLIFQSQRSDSY